MKRSISVLFCLALGSALVSAQTPLTGDAAGLVSRVKQTPASQLDSALPPMMFEKWLLLQAGKDATVGWVARTPADSANGPTLVEADVTIQGRPGIVVMISSGTSEGGPKPAFRSLQLLRAGESAEWPRLRDLPVALKKAREGVQ